MTRNKKAKTAARALTSRTGMSYTRARRATRTAAADGETYRPPSREQLLEPYLQGTCDRLVDGPITHFLEVDLTGLPELLQPAVHGLELWPGTIVVEVVDRYDGGGEVCNISVQAALAVDGLMPKGEANLSAAIGQVEIIDAEFNRHDAAVLATSTIHVELQFSATLTPDVESVEDVTFLGMSGI